MRPIEGFYVRIGRAIMAVKGVLQPPGRVIALPVYIPSKGGLVRVRNFRKSLSYFIKNYPKYYTWFNFSGGRLPSPPLRVVDEIYNPLRYEDHVPEEVERFLRILSKWSGIDEGYIGVTGSALLGLYSGSSDIDIVIYGVRNGDVVYEAMKKLREAGVLKAVGRSFNPSGSRPDSTLSKNTWIKVENSKILTGRFMNRIYTSKIVPLPQEYWEDLHQDCSRIGRVEFIGVVSEDRYSYLTPNRYRVIVKKKIKGAVKVGEEVEVVSMRSRFAEMASLGELVKVVGRLEYIRFRGKTWKRVFLGNEPEDIIISLHYL